MNENAILDEALLALKNNTDIESGKTNAINKNGNELHYDFALTLKQRDAIQHYHVLIKQRPSLVQLALLIDNDKEDIVNDTTTRNDGAKTLLVADYVDTKASEFLKNHQCHFIDSVGNAYLNFGSVFVYITGNKAPKKPAESKPSRAFQSTGLKLIFNLLCHPDDILNRSYRDLSEICGVSLGSIGWIINDLKAAGYLSLTENDQRKWADRNGLIQRWVVAYAEKLRPKLLLGYYKSLQRDWYKTVDPKSFSASWGGEVAADHLTHYLKSEFSTVYTDESLGKLVLLNGLKEVPEKSTANVEVLQKFWHFDNPKTPDLVPPLLVYADLIASGDSRNMETANIIYREFLDDHH